MRWNTVRDYFPGGRKNLALPGPAPIPASAVPAADDPLAQSIREGLDEHKRRQFEADLAKAIRRQRDSESLTVVEHGRPE